MAVLWRLKVGPAKAENLRNAFTEVAGSGVMLWARRVPWVVRKLSGARGSVGWKEMDRGWDFVLQ